MSESSVGDRLRQLRSERGLTQREVAIGADVVEKTVIRAEKTGAMNVETLMKLSEFFGVSADYLLRGDAPETTYEPVHDETLSDEDYAIEGVRRDLGPLETAEVEFLRSEFQAAQFSVGRLESEMAISRLKSKLREYRGKLPPPERERVEEPKRAKGESIRDAVLGKKPKR